jgi:hypothetical protein
VDIPALRPDRPLRGILSCMGRSRETIYVSSFSQPALAAGLASSGVSLGPYPASNLGPYRPGDLPSIPAGSSRTP